MTTLEDLKKSGWQDVIKMSPKRAIMSIEGLDKTGKSRLAMTAPEPIVYLDLDIGTEGVIEPMMAQRQIIRYQVDQPPKLGTSSELISSFTPIWEDIRARVSEALQLESGTLVIDSFGEAYEICRLAHFGKLAQVQPHQYQVAYAQLREIVRVAYKSSMNLILLHKLGNNFHTGELEHQGWKDVPFVVQATLRTHRKDGDFVTGPVFSAEVMSCRKDMTLMGQTLMQGQASQPGQIPHSLDLTKFLDIIHS